VNRSLRIGIDVRGLEVETSLRRGIGRYVCNLIRALADQTVGHQITLLGDAMPWHVAHLAPLLERGHVRYVTYHPTFASELDVLLLTDPAPVLTGRKLLAYPLNGLPCATIFYDLIPLAFEREYLEPNPQLQQEYFARLEEASEVASLFLTISRFVAEDLHVRLGVEPSRIEPVMGGLDEAFRDAPSAGETEAALKRLGISDPYFLYTGGTDFRKNVSAILAAFWQMQAQSPRRVKLVLSGEFSAAWRQQAESNPDFREHMQDIITLGYVSDEDLRCLYAGAIAFVFPSLYEGFGLPALEAMASGCPVIVSDGSSLKEIVGDAGLLVNPARSAEIARAMLRVFAEPSLAASLREKGVQRAKQYTWEDVAARTFAALGRIARPGRTLSAPSRRMRVLLQNRSNAFESPGGDTVVMEELYRTLRAYDVDVEAAGGSPDLADVDLVHLVNLTVTRTGEEVARNCSSQGVPFVLTALFEDWPLYLNPSFESAGLFKEYLESGQDEAVFARGLARLHSMPAGPRVGGEDIAHQAAMLFACGESEAARLAEAYPQSAGHIRIAKFGIRPYTQSNAQGKAMVKRALGVDSYALCCGRLETRKNQLMLLKALEDSELPIVLASGGFSYQPPYVTMVTRFRRRGPVRVLGRVSLPTLREIMAAATVHVLPSWYELPGLVTLEAASAGTAVVASDWGAIRDYLPEGLVHTCQPDDPASIRAAIERALAAGPNPEAKEQAERHTWEAFGEATYSAYEHLLSRSRASSVSSAAVPQEESNIQRYPSVEETMNSAERMTPRFDASIIIPVYNRSRLTQECLEALSAVECRASYEVIVVDNHSTDETPRILQALEGDVTILRQSENRGFAAACNRGARVASGEFLVFLNNDTKPQPGWLDALVDCARAESNAGAVGSRLLYPDGNVQHAGVAISEAGIPYHILQNFGSEHPAVTEQRDMQAVTAACMLMPAQLFHEFGGFDEGYRNGFEDIDLCMRIRARQYRVIYCPQSTVIHHEEASEGRKAHDAENLNRFLNRWQAAIQPDELQLLARYGLTISWKNGIGTYGDLPKKTEPQHPEATIESAQKLYADGQLEEAATVLQSLVESRMVLGKEDSFETYQTLGNCLARLNRIEEAEKAYCEAIKLDEASDRPYLGLGALAMLQENWQAAMYGFMTALAKNPGTIRGEFGVALSMAVRNMHCDALEHFRRVLEKDSNNAEALFYFYRSAVESGQPQMAIEPLTRYLDSHPRDTNFLFSLCGAYWKSGEMSRAVDLCQRVLELDPNHVAAREVMEHLQSTVLEHA
jgi:glycosyltransferase involved in cell wall biosynthesis/GT2 family glycosyltransferase